MILNPFALRSTPFSWLRFGAFMAGLAVIAGISLLPAKAPELARDAAQSAAGQAATTEAQFGVVRFGAPAEEIRGQLGLLGLPWFLRKQGASGQFDWDGDGNATLRVIWRGQSVGRFVERLVTIDADRSKLLVAFAPGDPAGQTCRHQGFSAIGFGLAKCFARAKLRHYGEITFREKRSTFAAPLGPCLGKQAGGHGCSKQQQRRRCGVGMNLVNAPFVVCRAATRHSPQHRAISSDRHRSGGRAHRVKKIRLRSSVAEWHRAFRRCSAEWSIRC